METQESYPVADALADVAAARVRVADRLQAPAYYFPSLGAALAVLMGSEAAGEPWSLLGPVLCGLTTVLLALNYRERSGAWVEQRDVPARISPIMALFAATLFVLLVLAFVVQFTGRSAWWGLPLGATTFVVTVLVGRVAGHRAREALLRGGTAVAAGRR